MGVKILTCWIVRELVFYVVTMLGMNLTRLVKLITRNCRAFIANVQRAFFPVPIGIEPAWFWLPAKFKAVLSKRIAALQNPMPKGVGNNVSDITETLVAVCRITLAAYISVVHSKQQVLPARQPIPSDPKSIKKKV